jgi:hypothetical protein
MTGYESKSAAAAVKLFEDHINYGTSWSKNGERIDPASVYLEQPAQEPFGWYSAQEDEFMSHKIRKEHERLNSYTHINGKFDLALYTTPPKREWVGLTDEEIHGTLGYNETREMYQFALALIAKLKEKNS